MRATLPKTYAHYEPYQLMHTYLEFIRADVQRSYELLKEDTDPKLSLNFWKIIHNVFADSGRVIQIDETLIPLLEDTDAEYESLKLPYETLFINRKFEFEKGHVLGIAVTTVDTDSRIWVAFLYSHDKTNEEEDEIHFGPLNEYALDNYDVERSGLKEATIYAHRFVSNFINFLNSPELNDFSEYVVTGRSKEKNLEKIQKGKAPIFNKTYIRLGTRLQQYCREYTAQRGTIHVRFLVRGHWREFKDTRYKTVRGKKVWIKPFFKNEDKLITKKPEKIFIKQ